MKLRCLIWLLSAALILSAASPCIAEVEWSVRKELKLDAVPLDLAVTASGQWIFVLTATGDVQVFSSEGVLSDKFHVGEGFDGISTGAQEEILYLNKGNDRAVQIVQVDFIRRINTDGAPSKGPADASVVLAVFTDFQ